MHEVKEVAGLRGGVIAADHDVLRIDISRPDLHQPVSPRGPGQVPRGPARDRHHLTIPAGSRRVRGGPLQRIPALAEASC